MFKALFFWECHNQTFNLDEVIPQLIQPQHMTKHRNNMSNLQSDTPT